MGTERKRKVSLFDVVDDTSASAKLSKSNGAISTYNQNSLINRWNGRPYSQRYYDILEKRKTLPVWHQKEEFLQALMANQSLILVGETGSGKTTQVRFGKILFYFVFDLSVFFFPFRLAGDEKLKLKSFMKCFLFSFSRINYSIIGYCLAFGFAIQTIVEL